MEFTTKLKLDQIIAHHNLAELLEDKELSSLGQQIHQDFEADLQSREGWEKRNEEAMKLALQIKEAKTFPWPNASNIKFPLITIAALQYHARAYPVLVSGDTPVKCKILGDDPDGMKMARARRVEAHMSYQIMEEDEAWESEFDRVLITQPILGCAFKKTYRDTTKGSNTSEYVLPKDLVVNYWTKSLETAPRLTHILYMSQNDIYERVAREIWLDISGTKPKTLQESGLKSVQDKSQGLTQPDNLDSSTPFEILEHHCSLDLDGDGYAEPYIVYMRRDTKEIARIVARFFPEGVKKNSKGKVLSITAEQYFTKFPFIPSPDGGFYDLGFGVLLGPLNESINTLLNQLVDAGTMANTAGGFLSRGVKMRGGNYTFTPLEWKHVESTGDDLRKGIMPLPVREPSQVLFTLLSLLINYGERIGGSVDILSGITPGQNTPAETSRNATEQGMKIFSGIFKRTYRSLRDEFRKQYRLNQLYLTDNLTFSDDPKAGKVLVADYREGAGSIRPAADPNIVSDSQRMMQAEAIRAASKMAPGYNVPEVEREYLRALKVSNIEQIYPDPKGPNAIQAGPSEKIQLETMKQETKKLELQLEMKKLQMEMMIEVELTRAKIHDLEAKAILTMAQASGISKDQELAVLNTQIAAAKANQDNLLKYMGLLQKTSSNLGQTPGQGPEALPAEPQVPTEAPVTQM
jgi:chaperonin GroES